MNNSKNEGENRREFLKKGAVLVLGLGYFGGVALEELLAASRESGKPLLTVEGFTARIPSPRKAKAFHSELEAIRRDLVAYVDAHFYLPPGQLKNFKNIPAGDITALNEALTAAENNKRKIVVRTELAKADCADGLGFRLRTIVDGQTLIVQAYRG